MFETIRERIPFQAQYATKRIVPATQTARTAATAGNPRKMDLVGSAETLKNVMKGKCEAKKTAVSTPSPSPILSTPSPRKPSRNLPVSDAPHHSSPRTESTIEQNCPKSQASKTPRPSDALTHTLNPSHEASKVDCSHERSKEATIEQSCPTSQSSKRRKTNDKWEHTSNPSHEARKVDCRDAQSEGSEITAAKLQMPKPLHETSEVDCRESQSEGSEITAAKPQVSTDSPFPWELPPAPPPVPVLRPVGRYHPHQETDTSLHLPSVLAKLLQRKAPMHPPKFRFDVSREAAAEFNFNLLKSNGFDLHSLLNPKEHCVTNYGSEFKAVEDLQALLKRHPRWEAMKSRLSRGCEFPVKPIDDDTRRKDVEGALARGNHRSALKHENHLAESMIKETKKGWNLLLLEEHARHIPGLEMAPMGVADQLGVSATGEFIEKLRVTHDLSFPGSESKESINSRVIKDKLEPIMFGHALIRVIHYIVNLRRRHPTRKIWIRKEDFKSAYRRIHLRASTAKQAAIKIIINGVSYVMISLRLPFGGSPCPADFCVVSDIVTDSINDLLGCTEWDESMVFSNFIKHVPPPEQLEDDDTPFAQARSLSVTLPVEDEGKCDGYIDDLMTCAVDIGNNLARIVAAPCTIIHALAHDSEGDTVIPRDDMVALDKCEAEGAASEERICLGWSLNTRSLLVSLPSHKVKAWISQVETFIKNKTASYKDLQSVLGRLENVTILVRMGAHFLNNIRALEIRASASKHTVKINGSARADFVLWKKIIQIASEGISMNLLTFRSPDHVIIGDACEHGLGAFNTKGRGWRWIIPPDLRSRAHINLLEFLTQVLQVWVDILEGRIRPGDCILAMGDNTSAMGWMRRSNFREQDESSGDWFVKQQVARKLADLVLTSKTVLYTQWFKGESNVGTDSLSRDCLYLSNTSHETLLKMYATPQVPGTLSVRPLPKEIVSFATSILQQLPVKKQRFVKPKPSELLLGVAGTLSSSPSGLESRFSSTECPSFNGTSLSHPLLKQCEKQLSLHEIKKLWSKAQSTPPSHLWHRPSGQTLGKTPDWTQTVRLASSSKNSTVDTEIKTRQE